VYDTDLESREKTDPESVHIINIDIQDNQEEATIGAFMICDLCTLVRVAEISRLVVKRASVIVSCSLSVTVSISNCH